MRLLIQSTMIFFGTLLVAGLLALGEPRAAASGAVHDATGRDVLPVFAGSRAEATATPQRP